MRRQPLNCLKRNRTSIAKYLHQLRNTEQDVISLISREFRDDTRYKSSANAMATTWVVSFSQVRAHYAVAADILAFMSCVEWKGDSALSFAKRAAGRADLRS